MSSKQSEEQDTDLRNNMENKLRNTPEHKPRGIFSKTGATLLLLQILYSAILIGCYVYLKSNIDAIIIVSVIYICVNLLTSLFIFKKYKTLLRKALHDVRTPLTVIKINSEVALLDEMILLETKKTLEESVVEVNKASELLSKIC